FNAMVSATGIEEWIGPAPVPMPVRIDVNPNPLGTTARLRLVNPRGSETAVELYDATGSIVRTLELRNGAAVLDGRRLADGIYFARVAGSESPVAKVVVSH
ncbi:T9SS type A sorting domain-containing protein, partial [candidate division WOR-3 bacterium]|nr:T9SS type A sorting domain-containing protein [candidate division WOR-3 bacterium]